MLPWDLEDWITDAGADILDKRDATGGSLSPHEELTYEIWLLDTEARNGGLSQYFLNHGLGQWRSCCIKAQTLGLESFAPFAEEVGKLLLNNSDPYEAIRHGGDAAEDLWYKYQVAVVRDLRALCQ